MSPRKPLPPSREELLAWRAMKWAARQLQMAQAATARRYALEQEQARGPKRARRKGASHGS